MLSYFHGSRPAAQRLPTTALPRHQPFCPSLLMTKSAASTSPGICRTRRGTPTGQTDPGSLLRPSANLRQAHRSRSTRSGRSAQLQQKFEASQKPPNDVGSAPDPPGLAGIPHAPGARAEEQPAPDCRGPAWPTAASLGPTLALRSAQDTPG